MRTFSRSRLLLVAAVVSVFLLAACGGGDDPALTPPTGAADGESTSFNDADVEFVQGMIPHHEEATQMAELAPDRTDREELRAFAEKVIRDQSTEIDEMRSMLTAADVEETPGHGMDGMSGQMSEEEMTELEGLSGQEFDLMFLDMMTRHHEGAIEMAEQVLEEGENPQVADLANSIIEAQRAEIDQMSDWRTEWSS